MSDETNREQAEQPNPQTDENVNPETGNERVGEQEAEDRGATESNETTTEAPKEALEFFEAAKEANITDARAFASEFTRRSQRLAELEREQQQWQTERQQIRELFEKEKNAQANPADELWEAYENEYDPERRAQLRRAALDAERQAWTPQAAQTALQAWELRQAVEQSSSIGGLKDPNEVVRRASSRSISDQVLAENLLAAYKDGNLLNALKSAEDARAAEDLKRKRMDSLLGQGSPGAVPGDLDKEQEDKTIDPHAFYAMAPAARKKKYGFEELPLK